MTIVVVLDRASGRQVGHPYPTAAQAQTDWHPSSRFEVLDVTYDLVCMATDLCTGSAVTVVTSPGWQAASVHHHVPVCEDHTDPATWGGS